MPGTMISIMVFEGYKLTRAAMKALLESWADFRVVAEAADCSTAIELAKEFKPDIILAHMGLSDEGQTLFLLNSLRDTDIQAKVILISELNDTARLIRAVALGAMGVVTKDQPPEVLAKAIRKVHEGEVWLERALTARALKEITESGDGSRNESAIARPELLSDRERQVIALVCWGLRNEAIGRWLAISEATVRHHLTSVFAKLSLQNRMELVIYAFNNGLHRSRKDLPPAPDSPDPASSSYAPTPTQR